MDSRADFGSMTTDIKRKETWISVRKTASWNSHEINSAAYMDRSIIFYASAEIRERRETWAILKKITSCVIENVPFVTIRGIISRDGNLSRTIGEARSFHSRRCAITTFPRRIYLRSIIASFLKQAIFLRSRLSFVSSRSRNVHDLWTHVISKIRWKLRIAVDVVIFFKE